MKPSENYVLTEEQSKLDAINRANQEINDRTKIFWSKAEKLVIGNFIPERRADNGRVIQREVGIHFYEHIKTSDDQVVIDFIRNSDSFKSGLVMEVATLAEAQMMTIKQTNIKSGMQSVSESDVEITDINFQK